MKKFAFLSALALAVALVAPALADQPACTGDRHYDEAGQCCPVTTTTLPCEGDDCDPGCPDPAPCPPVTVTCNVDVCVEGACVNGSGGTDGAGACTKDTDCPTSVTTTNTTTNNTFNVTVNRCPAQEDLIPCRRNPKTGKLTCPKKNAPYRQLVPYTKAKATQGVGAKRPLP